MKVDRGGGWTWGRSSTGGKGQGNNEDSGTGSEEENRPRFPGLRKDPFQAADFILRELKTFGLQVFGHVLRVRRPGQG